MKAYHIVAKENGWKIVGSKKKLIFKTKESAILEAKEILKSENVPLIIHAKDGRVIEVESNYSNITGRKIYAAKVKRTLNRKDIRNIIATIMFETTHK
jgi:hypothetical protein